MQISIRAYKRNATIGVDDPESVFELDLADYTKWVASAGAEGYKVTYYKTPLLVLILKTKPGIDGYNYVASVEE